MPNSPINRAEYEQIVEILRADIRNSHRDLKQDMAEGFEKINNHLALLNGKTATHGEKIAGLESKSGRIDVASLLSLLSLLVAGAVAWFSGGSK